MRMDFEMMDYWLVDYLNDNYVDYFVGFYKVYLIDYCRNGRFVVDYAGFETLAVAYTAAFV